jgi:hypothetical protein
MRGPSDFNFIAAGLGDHRGITDDAPILRRAISVRRVFRVSISSVGTNPSWKNAEEWSRNGLRRISSRSPGLATVHPE